MTGHIVNGRWVEIKPDLTAMMDKATLQDNARQARIINLFQSMGFFSRLKFLVFPKSVEYEVREIAVTW